MLRFIMATCLRKVSDMFLKFSHLNFLLKKDIPTKCIGRNHSTVTQKLVYSEYGDPAKVLRIEEEKLRLPDENEVVIKMLAAPVNPADINTIQGSYPIKPPLPSIAGNEGVGEIIAIGIRVPNLRVGDMVLPSSNAWGTWRTYAVCRAEEVMKLPHNIGVLEAATISVNPCTAYRMLKDFVPLSADDTVIQNGANSAAGQCVIQICNAWGLKSVNIVRNRENIDELKDFLTNLGATHVLTEEELRTTDIFKKEVVRKPKLALNCVGGKNALEVMRQLDHGGTMVTYGGMSREPVTAPTSALIFKNIQVRGFWMTQWNKDNQDSDDRKIMINDLVQLVMVRQLKPPVHKVIPFNQYSEALLNTMQVKGFSGAKYILDFQNA